MRLIFRNEKNIENISGNNDIDIKDCNGILKNIEGNKIHISNCELNLIENIKCTSLTLYYSKIKNITNILTSYLYINNVDNLKSISINSFHIQIKNCPLLETIIIEGGITKYLQLENLNNLKELDCYSSKHFYINNCRLLLHFNNKYNKRVMHYSIIGCPWFQENHFENDNNKKIIKIQKWIRNIFKNNNKCMQTR